MSLFIASAHAQAAGQAPQGGELFQIGFLVMLFVLFYFIAIRPQRKRQKEHQQMVSELTKGAEIVTTAGILGKIVALDDNVADVDAYSILDVLFVRNPEFSFRHSPLDLGGALDGIDNAGELHQQAISCCLDDASAVLVDLGVDQGCTMGLLPLDRTCLVGSHESAVADHVSRQYCGQPTLGPVLSHLTTPIRVPRGSVV